ncbi:hypothetical protein BJ138DRAFT_1106601 [Hygrophoropsis aurantiaca]|uniref:Uncharacterized protein n=1 Tax=Hygrophoropsis aurantiaca TaxID=72124 RepID=A0ACB7ZWG5_9AGAM|nr:hypothetical protein BJ138DRAFT_1106601 [Hygrophoropsis aurantiaca]
MSTSTYLKHTAAYRRFSTCSEFSASYATSKPCSPESAERRILRPQVPLDVECSYLCFFKLDFEWLYLSNLATYLSLGPASETDLSVWVIASEYKPYSLEWLNVESSPLGVESPPLGVQYGDTPLTFVSARARNLTLLKADLGAQSLDICSVATRQLVCCVESPPRGVEYGDTLTFVSARASKPLSGLANCTLSRATSLQSSGSLATYLELSPAGEADLAFQQWLVAYLTIEADLGARSPDIRGAATRQLVCFKANKGCSQVTIASLRMVGLIE